MASLKSFFTRQVQHAFGQLGIGDQSIIGHISEVLCGFANAENLYRMRSMQGQRVDSIVHLVGETRPQALTRLQLERERDLRQYIGDYALFMSGMFRSHVERGSFLELYLNEGSRSYRAVSEMDLSLYRTGFMLFQELADRFELYSGALDYLRKSQFAPGATEDPFADFLRQVDGWIRVGISDN